MTDLAVKSTKRNGPHPVPVAERIQRNIMIVGGCWIWIGATTKGGYGVMNVGGRMTCAHRASYETSVGPIAQGLTIDHLCRFPPCVNPAHLEAVTMAENNRRGFSRSAMQARQTNCPKCGGDYTSYQTLRRGRTVNYRRCLHCNRENGRRFLARRRAAEVTQ